MRSVMSHRAWIAVSGFLWLAVGGGLLFKGLRLISEGAISPDSLSFRMQGLFGTPQQSGTALIAAALLIGYVKGRFILSKTVKRVALRIASLPLPIRFTSVYAPSYFVLIGGMIALGILLRFLPIPIDLRGFIDTAIGSALINGAMLYFQAARGAQRV
jgi:hypothetical protein